MYISSSFSIFFHSSVICFTSSHATLQIIRMCKYPNTLSSRTKCAKCGDMRTDIYSYAGVKNTIPQVSRPFSSSSISTTAATTGADTHSSDSDVAVAVAETIAPDHASPTAGEDIGSSLLGPCNSENLCLFIPPTITTTTSNSTVVSSVPLTMISDSILSNSLASSSKGTFAQRQNPFMSEVLDPLPELPPISNSLTPSQSRRTSVRYSITTLVKIKTANMHLQPRYTYANPRAENLSFFTILGIVSKALIELSRQR